MEALGLDEWDPLPKCIHKKNGAYFLVKKNKWLWLGRRADAARLKYAEVAASLGIPYADRDFVRSAFIGARKRAKHLRVEFDIAPADVLALWKAGKNRCALTGMPFDGGNVKTFRRRPMIPSIDRIDARLGYVPGNVRLISFAMNAALNEWGEATFEKMARAYLANLP